MPTYIQTKIDKLEDYSRKLRKKKKYMKKREIERIYSRYIAKNLSKTNAKQIVHTFEALFGKEEANQYIEHFI